jgi:hypothetical protein
MKLEKILFIAIAVLVLFPVSSITRANDFDWTENLNFQAQKDPSGFRAQLATRFNIGDVQVGAVLSNVKDPADAYIMLRLGEMSGTPVGDVLVKYKQDKGKGWGELAKSLGIKPGSREFHDLKRGHDLTASHRRGKILYSSSAPDNVGAGYNGKGKGKGNK